MDIYNSNNKKLENQELVYTFNDYLRDAKNKPDNDMKTKKILDAIDVYCQASENYFNDAHNELDFGSYVPVYEKPDLQGTKMALVLGRRPYIRIFYNGEENSATLSFKAKEVYSDNYTEKIINIKSTEKDGKKYFELDRDYAKYLTVMMELKIGDKVVKFRPVDYGWLAENRPPDTKVAELQDLCHAVSYYADALKYYYYGESEL